jgi:RHH-type proline utilization regulon transcriptional repressor/proline dehydrogenase/delta 1-pyrroline-5-carboxylate dehydrogenase
MVDERALQDELGDIGRRLAAAMPVTRNPLKAIDEKAMDLASQDAELKAALFRFVDVVPACRSLEDLARHLTGFLGEVEQPTAPIGVAMKMGNSNAGRAALGAAAAGWPERPQLERDSAGPLPRANLSVKVSALTPLLRPDGPERGKRDAAERLRPLLRRAHDLGAHLHIDMESMDSRDAVLELILELLSEDEFRSGPSAGLVLQAYLRDSPQTLDTILEWLGRVERAHPLTVRLVKGAYWDHEIVEARQHGWVAPVFEVKADCDLNFEALTRRLLDARPAVRVAVASHNLRSVSHAIAYNRLSGGADEDLELQVLRGLGDPLQSALARQGLRVRTYCPVGDLVAGMAYLVRRLLENTSNESFLHEQARGAALDELLARPVASTPA